MWKVAKREPLCEHVINGFRLENVQQFLEVLRLFVRVARVFALEPESLGFLYAPANAMMSSSMRSVWVYGRPCAPFS
jgi:hypothetical protein